MLALQFILADGVTIKLGDNVWTFGFNLIIYLIVAAVVGLVAESIVGRRLPFVYRYDALKTKFLLNSRLMDTLAL